MATNTKLIFTLPDGSESKYSLSREGSYTLGTSHSCDITLDDPSLEEKHGKLVADETNENRWFLQNLGDSSISFLDDGTNQQLGHTHLQVIITKVEEEPEPEEPVDIQSQLTELEKTQQAREFKSATILIIACAILSFAAGVAYRILSN